MGCRRTDDCIQGHNARHVCPQLYRSCPRVSSVSSADCTTNVNELHPVLFSFLCSLQYIVVLLRAVLFVLLLLLSCYCLQSVRIGLLTSPTSHHPSLPLSSIPDLKLTCSKNPSHHRSSSYPPDCPLDFNRSTGLPSQTSYHPALFFVLPLSSFS